MSIKTGPVGTVQNAIIKSSSLSIADRDMLTASIWFEYGDGSSQGFGGYMLYRLRDEYVPDDTDREYGYEPEPFQILSTAGHFVSRVMQIAGVKEWSKLGGQAIRVMLVDGRVTAVGHIIKDDWFDPAVDFAELNKQTGKN